ncbi:phytanoyl-CoA dioxygenase family protein [Marinoscillum sp.]|uniref:phytanoyl-CoA dioxygenase family protein n=1 Tax=Marinoscillum sp. TaxID=2024838 RepID=UPI003BAB1F8E
MKSLFKDPNVAQRYQEDGYVILDLLSPEEIKAEQAFFYHHVHDFDKEPLYESSRNNSDQTNDHINDHLQKVFLNKTLDHIQNAKVYGGTYMVKPVGSEDYLPLHQDWSIVEEDLFQTAFIWCPLQTTNQTNGGLFVVPGSHHFYQNRRSGSLPCPRITPNRKIKPYVKHLQVSEGQVIIYSDSVFHGSHPNTSQAPRIVATARLVEEGAQLTYYHRISDEEVGVFYFSKDTYLNGITQLVQGTIPEGLKPEYHEDYRNEDINEVNFIQKIKRHLPSPTVLSRLAAWFDYSI